jgi:hypothetical protein
MRVGGLLIGEGKGRELARMMQPVIKAIPTFSHNHHFQAIACALDLLLFKHVCILFRHAWTAEPHALWLAVMNGTFHSCTRPWLSGTKSFD